MSDAYTQTLEERIVELESQVESHMDTEDSLKESMLKTDTLLCSVAERIYDRIKHMRDSYKRFTDIEQGLLDVDEEKSPSMTGAPPDDPNDKPEISVEEKEHPRHQGKVFRNKTHYYNGILKESEKVENLFSSYGYHSIQDIISVLKEAVKNKIERDRIIIEEHNTKHRNRAEYKIAYGLDWAKDFEDSIEWYLDFSGEGDHGDADACSGG